MYCTNCGAGVPTSALYCGGCGIALEGIGLSVLAERPLDHPKQSERAIEHNVDPVLRAMNAAQSYIGRSISFAAKHAQRNAKLVGVVMLSLMAFIYIQIGYAKYVSITEEISLGSPVYWALKIIGDIIGVVIILSALSKRRPYWLREKIDYSLSDFSKSDVAINAVISSILLLPVVFLYIREFTTAASLISITFLMYVVIVMKLRWVVPFIAFPLCGLIFTSLSRGYKTDAAVFSFSSSSDWAGPLQGYVAVLFALSALPAKLIVGRVRGDCLVSFAGGKAFVPFGSSLIVFLGCLGLFAVYEAARSLIITVVSVGLS